jgi:hypothetical protein
MVETWREITGIHLSDEKSPIDGQVIVYLILAGGARQKSSMTPREAWELVDRVGA